MDPTKPPGDQALSVLLKTFLNKRKVITVEHEALGVPDVDADRVRERAFCSPGMLQEVEDDAVQQAHRSETVRP